MSSSHCSFELKIMCDTFCCFPQFFNLWTFKKFTIITLWVKTFKVNYEFLHSWTVRNQKDTMRGGEMTKVKREEKKDLVAWFLLGMIIFLWSVHLHYSLQWLEGSPERTPRQNDVGYWLEKLKELSEKRANSILRIGFSRRGRFSSFGETREFF